MCVLSEEQVLYWTVTFTRTISCSSTRLSGGKIITNCRNHHQMTSKHTDLTEVGWVIRCAFAKLPQYEMQVTREKRDVNHGTVNCKM